MPCLALPYLIYVLMYVLMCVVMYVLMYVVMYVVMYVLMYIKRYILSSKAYICAHITCIAVHILTLRKGVLQYIVICAHMYDVLLSCML